MKKYILNILFISLFASCKIFNNYNQTIISSNLNNKNSSIILDLKNSNIISYYLSINCKAKINYNNSNNQINAQIRIKKDSIIWISLKAPLGIEIFRTALTKDSIYFINRTSKQYFISHINNVKEVLKTDLNFYDLQEIFFAYPNMLNKNVEMEHYNIEGNNQYRLSYIKNDIVEKEYLINNLFKLFKLQIYNSESGDIIVNFSNYKSYTQIENKLFPTHLEILLKSQDSINLNIDYTKIEFNNESTYSFNIPKSYEKIN